MKNLFRTISLSVAVTGALFIALPVSAQTVVPTVSASARVTFMARASSTRPFAGNRAAMAASTSAARMAAMKNRDNTEIGNRVTTLNNLLSRIQGMAKLSDAEKSSFSSEIQSEIGNLSSLQTNIGADTSTTSLRTDSQSITQAYRIYALVVPQGSIVAADDRISTMVTSFQTVAAKLETRITAAQTAGDNMSVETTTLADFTAKVSDASTQASAASSEVANLEPDNGDQTIMASNTAALKDARSKIQTATNDLKTAEEDATTVVKDIEALKLPSSTASSTQ